MRWERHVAGRDDAIGEGNAVKMLVKDRIVCVLLRLSHLGLITKPKEADRTEAYDDP